MCLKFNANGLDSTKISNHWTKHALKLAHTFSFDMNHVRALLIH